MLRKKSLEEGTSVKSLLVVELESNKRMWWQVEKLENRCKKYSEGKHSSGRDPLSSSG